MKPALIKRILFLAACFVTLVAFFYAEENWRGKRAWGKYKAQLEASGERLDPAALIPPKVPDELNFAMTPFLAPLFDFLPGTQQWRDTNAAERATSFAKPFAKASEVLAKENAERSNSWARGSVDFAAWLAAFPEHNPGTESETDAPSSDPAPDQAASAVLAVLTSCDPVLEELRSASQRPHTRFNIHYEEPNPAAILLPHLAVLKRICQVLQVRASAQLALGRTDAALKDIHLMFHLVRALRDDPTLIAHLVRIAEFEMVLQNVYDGIAGGRWSEAQLRALQDQLEQLDFCAGARRAFETERAFFGGALIDYIRRSPGKYRNIFPDIGSSDGNSPGFDPTAALIATTPSGWFYLEQVNYHQMFQEYFFAAIDAANHRLDPSVCRTADAKLSAACSGPWHVMFLEHRSLSAMLLPALSKVVQRSAFAQAGADAAATACALERYKLAKSQYPDSLGELRPQFIAKLPNDVTTGQPLKYRRSGAGRFQVYSIGWNETDDDGTIAYHRNTTRVDRLNGDWVWQ